MSIGQNKEETLKRWGARHACTPPNTARRKRWQLVRDLRAAEKVKGGHLEIGELLVVFDEWYRLSQPCLDPSTTHDDNFAAFLAELGKVRVPTGEGDTINQALGAVSKLMPSELPVIPGYADAPQSWRRVLALHRELSRRAGGNSYFVSSRDAAKVAPGMNHRVASDINHALDRFGVVKIIRVGDQRPNGKASEFRYLM